MSIFGYVFSPGLTWLTVGVLLAIAELLVPGVFLVFIAIGCVVTGLVLLVAPELPLVIEVLLFAAATGAAVAIGRDWYRRSPVPSEDPLLNDRAARLVGEVVTVVEAIRMGRGRVKIGDGEWNASGPDVPQGAQVRITGASGTVLGVEPVS